MLLGHNVLKCVFLVLLDLSAAFDTVTHDVMLDRLKSRFGITGDAQRWIASYLKAISVGLYQWEEILIGTTNMRCTTRISAWSGSLF